MPKNTVSDPITDKEMAFAHLVLSGTQTRRAPGPRPGAPPSLNQNFDPNPPNLANPFINPPLNRVPDAAGSVFDAVLEAASSPGAALFPQKGLFWAAPLSL
jgi:hypothetical protein